jgi:hypothetical protein
MLTLRVFGPVGLCDVFMCYVIHQQVTSAMRLYLTNPMTQSILLTPVLRAVTEATAEVSNTL